MRYEGVNHPVTGCTTWCMGGCEYFSLSQCTALPRTNNGLLQLTGVLIVVGVFIKFTIQTLNAQLSERFTDHQRVTTPQQCLEVLTHLIDVYPRHSKSFFSTVVTSKLLVEPNIDLAKPDI